MSQIWIFMYMFSTYINMNSMDLIYKIIFLFIDLQRRNVGVIGTQLTKTEKYRYIEEKVTHYSSMRAV